MLGPLSVPRRAGGVPQPDAAGARSRCRSCRRAAAGTSWPASRRSCCGPLAETPDPDMALVNLEKVTGSLGAKAVLWELFSFNPPSLKLYVDLCAWSQFLSEILINNPGMIDELLDSLVLNQPRTAEELRAGAGRPVPRRRRSRTRSCTAFRTRNCCASASATFSARTRSSETTAALSDLAETILAQIAALAGAAAGQALRRARTWPRAARRAAEPLRPAGPGQARRPGDELPQRPRPDPGLRRRWPHRAAARARSRFDRFELTDNFHFFTELAQRIIKATSFLGPMGRLYQVDMRLRPTGKSGSLVIPLDRVPPLLRGRRRPALGAAGADPRPGRLRRRRISASEVMAGRRAAAPTAWPGSRSWPTKSATCASALEASRQRPRPEARLRRHRRRRVPGAALPAQVRPTIPGVLRTPNTWEALEALRDSRLVSGGGIRRRCAPATTSCAWSRAGCASSTTARWTNCPTTRTTWKSWPGALVSKALLRLQQHNDSSKRSSATPPRRATYSWTFLSAREHGAGLTES